MRIEKMRVFEIYVNGTRAAWQESLSAAQDNAMQFVDRNSDVWIEHPAAPAPTAKWRYDREVTAWVRSDNYHGAES